MPAKKVLEKRYGTRTVLWKEIYKKTPSWKKIAKVLCRCDCWTKKYVQRRHLLSWASTNCGCLKTERITRIAKEHAKHGMEWTIPYKKYMSAKARCTNKNNDSYCRYWGRGIKMLRSDFSEFWKDMWESYLEHVKQYWEKNTTIERIDVDWDYCKENCRRATWAEQFENMSVNHPVSYKWKQFPTIAKLCRETWTKYWLVRDRIKWGRTVEEAVDLPLWTIRHVKNTKRQDNKPSSCHTT